MYLDAVGEDEGEHAVQAATCLGAKLLPLWHIFIFMMNI
jgi:hypothetical protein